MSSKSDMEGKTIESGSPKCSQELSVKKKNHQYIFKHLVELVIVL